MGGGVKVFFYILNKFKKSDDGKCESTTKKKDPSSQIFFMGGYGEHFDDVCRIYQRVFS